MAWLAGGGRYVVQDREVHVGTLVAHDTWDAAADFLRKLVVEAEILETEWALYMLAEIAFVYQAHDGRVFFLEERE